MSNRLTYRWFKGLEGWVPSAIAPNSWNASLEVEDQASAVETELGMQEVFNIPLFGQAVVDKEAEDWATLWQETT